MNYSASGLTRYWKVASGNYVGGRNHVKMTVNIHRLDTPISTRRLVMEADGGSLTYRPCIDEHDTDTPSYLRDLRVYKNTSDSTFDIYIQVSSFTYVDVEMTYSGTSITVYDTPTWETAQPTTSGTYLLEFTNGNLNAMKINNSGNVGIGTTNPQGQLHISSGDSGDCVLILEADTDNNNENDNPRIEFWQDGSDSFSAILQADNHLNLKNSIASGGIIFHTGTASGYTNAVERMRIQPNGRVGIGKTDPGSALDVVGDVAISGGISSTGLGVVGGINISGGQFRSEGYNVADDLGLLLEGGHPTSTSGENGTCGIGFNTRSRKNHIKGAILATPQSWGRSDIHICTNNLVGSGSTEENYKVSVADARLTVLSTGNVGIGTTNPVAKLTLNAYGNPGSTNCLIIGTNIASQNLRIGVDSTNEFCWIQSHAGKPLRLNPDGNQVQYGTSDTVLSDDRIKVNEVYIENATDTLLKLKPQIYDKKLIWNISKLGETSNTSIVREGGLITQDVWYDTPELRHLVHLGEGAEPGDDKPYTDNDPTNDPDYSSWGDNVSLLDYNGLIPYLIKSNQELHARIQALENAS